MACHAQVDTVADSQVHLPSNAGQRVRRRGERAGNRQHCSRRRDRPRGTGSKKSSPPLAAQLRACSEVPAVFGILVNLAVWFCDPASVLPSCTGCPGRGRRSSQPVPVARRSPTASHCRAMAVALRARAQCRGPRGSQGERGAAVASRFAQQVPERARAGQPRRGPLRDARLWARAARAGVPEAGLWQRDQKRVL